MKIYQEWLLLAWGGGQVHVVRMLPSDSECLIFCSVGTCGTDERPNYHLLSGWVFFTRAGI